jgi:hypothetical protein
MHLLEPKKLCLGFFAQYHTLIKIDTGGLLSTVLMSTILMQAPKFIASTEFHAATKHRGAAARVRRDAQGARIHAEQTTTKNEQHVLQHLTGCSSKQAVRAANSAAAETSAAAAITRIAIILLAEFKDSIGAQTQKKNLRAYTLGGMFDIIKRAAGGGVKSFCSKVDQKLTGYNTFGHALRYFCDLGTSRPVRARVTTRMPIFLADPARVAACHAGDATSQCRTPTSHVNKYYQNFSSISHHHAQRQADCCRQN